MSNCGDDSETRTASVREYYEHAARHYDSWMRAFDRVMLGKGRSRMVSRARGRTLEIAVGTGANLPHYRPDVDLTAVDLSPAMLAVAEQRARDLGVDVTLHLADAQHLEFPDNRFDTVTATLLMSTVPDPRLAAQEMHRVLKPGGRLLLLDFARSPIAPVRWIERALAPLTERSRFSLLRDPLDHLETIGFAIEHVDRFRLGVIHEVVAREI